MVWPSWILDLTHYIWSSPLDLSSFSKRSPKAYRYNYEQFGIKIKHAISSNNLTEHMQEKTMTQNTSTTRYPIISSPMQLDLQWVRAFSVNMDHDDINLTEFR